MTRRIILAVIFTAAIITNFSFSSSNASSSPSGNAISTSQLDRKFIIVCLNTGGCRFCGGVQVTPTSTTLCASASCYGVGMSICVSFANKLNPVTGKEEVDETSITIEYSDPALKAATNEAALKADFIQQVNAQL